MFRARGWWRDARVGGGRVWWLARWWMIGVVWMVGHIVWLCYIGCGHVGMHGEALGGRGWCCRRDLSLGIGRIIGATRCSGG